MKDHYRTLEVSQTASAAEIKRAYRRLAFLYHPDKNSHPSAEQVFKELNEAYDVLSDEEKRRNYDFSLLNQYAEIFQQPQGPMHRDPAYRKRKQNAYPPRERKPSNLELIHEYLPYFSWLNWAGIAIMVILAFDYFVPPLEATENVQQISWRSGRRTSGHYVITTNTGRSFALYNHNTSILENSKEIFITYTPLLHTVLEFTPKGGDRIYVGGIYNAIFIMPFAMFIIALLGIGFKKNATYHFNFSVGSGILIILVLFLIFIK